MATTQLTGTGITFPDGSTLSGKDDASKEANGYQKLPGGLIMQWGEFLQGAQNGSFASGSKTFAIEFPNACSTIFVSGGTCFSSVVTDRFGVTCNFDFLGYSTTGRFTVRFIAIGY
jgi:hypothetical protein